MGCHRSVINWAQFVLSVTSPRSFVTAGFPLPSRSSSAVEYLLGIYKVYPFASYQFCCPVIRSSNLDKNKNPAS